MASISIAVVADRCKRRTAAHRDVGGLGQQAQDNSSRLDWIVGCVYHQQCGEEQDETGTRGEKGYVLCLSNKYEVRSTISEVVQEDWKQFWKCKRERKQSG